MLALEYIIRSKLYKLLKVDKRLEVIVQVLCCQSVLLFGKLYLSFDFARSSTRDPRNGFCSGNRACKIYSLIVIGRSKFFIFFLLRPLTFCLV